MRKLCTLGPHIGDAKELEVIDAMDALKVLYLTYLQENFKPVAHRSASVEVFDEEDVRVVHPPPHTTSSQQQEPV